MRRRHGGRSDGGFTLIELLVVVVILGVLTAVAVPSYLGFRARAQQKTADADVREAIPAAEAYRNDNDTYKKMNLKRLKAYDQAIAVDIVKVSGDGKTYCLGKSVGGKQAYTIRGAAPHTPKAQGGTTYGPGDIDETGTCPKSVKNTKN